MTRQTKGFTLIELIVTVAIVGILASIAAPLAEVTVQRARESELRTALRQIREGLDHYKRATEEGRVERRADGNGYPRDLNQLADGVEDAKSPVKSKIYFLRRLPRDPMHPDAAKSAAETWGKRSYASSAEAPQEGEDVFDVYSLSKSIGLNGIAYKDW